MLKIKSGMVQIFVSLIASTHSVRYITKVMFIYLTLWVVDYFFGDLAGKLENLMEV